MYGLQNRLNKITGHPLTIVILSEKHLNILKRNNLNILDIHSYSVIRKVFSLKDIAEIEFLNFNLTIENKRISTLGCLTDLFNNLSPEEIQEISTSVVPLSYTEEIAHSVKTEIQLNLNSSLEKVNESEYYDFVKIDNKLFIIIKDGFFTAIENSTIKELFVKSYVKQCYAMVAIQDVSKLPIFKLYIDFI